MKNATGSKSARIPKQSKASKGPKARATPAQGGRPEVMLDNGTTVVLPNPADAPPPPKAWGRGKPEPTVATRPDAKPPAEIPDWAQRAATRDTAGEMAAVPEAAPVAEPTADATTAALVKKRGHRPKAATPETQAKVAPATKPGSLRAVLRDAGVRALQIPASAPNCNALAERFVKSIKDECLDKMIFFGTDSLLRACKDYECHYLQERNHQGIGNELIDPVLGDAEGSVRRRERLGGLLSYYYRSAA